MSTPSADDQAVSSTPQSDHDVTADAVLDRVLFMTGLKRDVDLSRLFGVSKSTITTWRRRNKIPYDEILTLHFQKKLDFTYCIIGQQRYSHLDIGLDKQGLKLDVRFWDAFRAFRTEMRRVYGSDEDQARGYIWVTRPPDEK